MGLVNAVVPHDQLDAEVDALVRRDHGDAARPRSPSPSARSTPTPSTIRGIAGMGMQALQLYYDTEEIARKACAPSTRSASRSSASSRNSCRHG